ncbi:hypothetical protein DV737_g104, partial [Chaetothyriales sp. CBS 132003]
MALGLGSLFNHSTLHQNVGWRRDLAIECIVYTALRDIEVGQELCISYGNGRLWFEDVDGGDDGEEEANTTRSGHGYEDTVEDVREIRGVLDMSELSRIETDLR